MRVSRKWCMITLIAVLFFLFFGLPYVRYIFHGNQDDAAEKCVQLPDNLYQDARELDAIIDNYKAYDDMINDYLPFIGNGYFGMTFNRQRSLLLKLGRTLNLSAPYYPIVTPKLPWHYVERSAIHLKHGIAYTFACYEGKALITNEYYAHRSLPNILVQQITIKNIYHAQLSFDLVHVDIQTAWNPSVQYISLPSGGEKLSYMVLTGKMHASAIDKFLVLCIVTRKLPIKVDIPASGTYKLTAISSIEYRASYITTKGSDDAEEQKNLQITAINNLEAALRLHYDDLRKDHVDSWSRLWSTGLSIGTSKAFHAHNGDLINATIYCVLSSSRDWYYEHVDNAEVKYNPVPSYMSSPYGCYGSNHHTLQADNLLSHLSTVDDVNTVVNFWLLTLEKQGCHNFVKAGATGIMQAMILSFGSFQFSKHHLAFNMNPKFLFRNYEFRRINYGNYTHVNVTVEVMENNKALIYVAVDRNDVPYYACDGGCLDEAVQLSTEKKPFTVKLTDPFTAILYITPDKNHIEDLQHTLHVKNVIEAPAQEYNVMVSHRHGHNFKGLPTFFWVSICTLIVIFHLFLIKLVCTEYKNQQTITTTTKARRRYEV